MTLLVEVFYMSKRTFNLITAVVGGVQTIAIGVITFLGLPAAAPINASIVIGGTAIIEICSQFVKE